MTVNFTSWKGITDGQTYGIPDSEDFEHNDLDGIYDGDLSAFEIQDTNVDEGTYALESDGDETHNGIVRTTRDEPWDRLGLKIEWRQYATSNANGGLLLIDGQDPSNSQGYIIQIRTDNGEVWISEWDGTYQTTLSTTSANTTTGQFIDCSLEMSQNGDLDFVADGDSVSVNDSSQTDLYLGFHVYRGQQYIDDVQFSKL